MSIRLRLIGISFLLCLALVSTVLAAAGTVQAYQQFQQSHQRIMVGDVTTVSSWMTLPYVAHVYNVPEGCLASSLHISQLQQEKHSTLRALADADKESVDIIINKVRGFILNYRQNKAICTKTPELSHILSFDILPLFGEEKESA